VASVKIRAMPAVLSLFVTLFVLFGGYFAYQWWMIEKPLVTVIRATPHVTLDELRVEPDQITIRLNADEDFSLTADYIPLRDRLAPFAGGRTVSIELADRPDAVLEAAWNRMVFGVAEAMVHRRYTQIPETVEAASRKEKIRHEVAMDDRFVYVALYHRDHSLYRILPLSHPVGEVKNHG
jgi:hypothetical protein